MCMFPGIKADKLDFFCVFWLFFKLSLIHVAMVASSVSMRRGSRSEVTLMTCDFLKVGNH